MKKYISLLLCLLPILSFSQKKKTATYQQQVVNDSKNKIKQLHDGVLLIRISNKQKSIDALRKVGQDKLATKVETEQRARNQRIVQAFKLSFDFCPTYFFSSDDSKYFLNNQLDSVTFLNENLEPDKSIKVDPSNYLTGEFGSIEQDATKQLSSTDYDQGEKKSSYSGGSGLTLTGFIIKNEQLYQLKHPFPYYTREYKGLLFQRSIEKVVVKMNTKLHNYYNENQ